jgi:hypothetical protein
MKFLLSAILLVCAANSKAAFCKQEEACIPIISTAITLSPFVGSTEYIGTSEQSHDLLKERVAEKIEEELQNSEVDGEDTQYLSQLIDELQEQEEFADESREEIKEVLEDFKDDFFN